jgi:hypothetical protein
MLSRIDFVEKIVAMHASGEIDAYRAYTGVYGDSHERYEGESDIDFIRRCAEQDYYDAQDGSCVYQNLLL